MSKTTLQKIGEELKKARLKKGLTQAEVAKRAGMGTNRYAIIERGEAENITIKKLEKIVETLEIKGSNILPF